MIAFTLFFGMFECALAKPLLLLGHVWVITLHDFNVDLISKLWITPNYLLIMLISTGTGVLEYADAVFCITKSRESMLNV